MRVKATRDHFGKDGEYRAAGDVFEHEGKLHEHIKAVKPKPAEEVEEDESPDAPPAETEKEEEATEAPPATGNAGRRR